MYAYDALYAASPQQILWADTPGRLVARLPHYRSGGSVLDAGCGDGKNALFLETVGFDVTGFDASPLALAGLRNRFARRGRRANGRYFVANAESWPVVERYDIVISYGLYHCLPKHSRPGVQARLFRAVRPGGLIVFATLTNHLPLPPEHGTYGISLATPSEVDELFAEFQVHESFHGTIEEEHRPTIGPHRHSVVWIIAQRS
jgi:SAM-dependent methyltransferase